MGKFILFFLVSISIQTTAWAQEPTPSPTSPPMSVKKVLLITLINAKYEDAIKQEYLAALAKKGALLENYHGVSHPSKPNMLALVSGDSFNLKNDHLVKLDGNNIVDLLEAKNQTWKVYAEDYPGKCSLIQMARLYKEKANPLLSFKNIQDNPSRCSKIVNAQDFSGDFKTSSLPNFAMYIPNQLHNGHDSDAKTASQWLAGFLSPLLENEKFRNETLIIVLFNQDYYYTPKNHVYAVMLNKNIPAGTVSKEHYNHYDMLRTIEDYLELETLGRKDAQAKIMADIWSSMK